MAASVSIEMTPLDTGQQFISTHFVTPKSDGRWRPLFNLKRLNEFVTTAHFKMESLHNVRELLPPAGFMAKLDLKDAFHSIPVHPSSRRWLRLEWKGSLSLGVRLIVYLDDWLILGPTAAAVRQGIEAAVFLLEHLGFAINDAKSQLSPSQEIEFLGIEVNSVRMIFTYPNRKLNHLQHECRRIANKATASLPELRCLVGKIQDCTKAIPLARAHSRGLQWMLNSLMGAPEGQRRMLPPEAQADLQWWVELCPAQCCKAIVTPPPSRSLTTDACDTGWGATSDHQMDGGPWRMEEMDYHINWKELKAAHLGLQMFFSSSHDCTIRLEMDNTTAVAYVNHQGGTHSYRLCQLALEIWQWAADRKIHLLAVHVPGVENVTADYLSRTIVDDSSDWMLKRSVFQSLHHQLGPFTRDLFAAWHNSQLPLYVSWHPDPEAEAVDALSVLPYLWENCYLLPPIALVGRCLQYVLQHQVRNAVLVAPAWPSQPYYPLLLEMIVLPPTQLPVMEDLLLDPQSCHHPLWDRLQLAAWTISGNQQHSKDFRRKLPRCGWGRGEPAPQRRTSQHGSDGWAGVVAGTPIPWRSMR
ncbi:uncharacterized protein LOC135808157 [Sycon ciliatum]|uniref:uncharacterized protein LOC135808157 n=1 Tax=Sycon ciliatum TaxID=27933 RepID=UPI0031F71706